MDTTIPASVPIELDITIYEEYLDVFQKFKSLLSHHPYLGTSDFRIHLLLG
jgi:hypothetical protein